MKIEEHHWHSDALGHEMWLKVYEDTRELDGLLRAKGIPAIVAYWGHDVDHDWAWWRQMLPLYLDRLGV